MPWRRSSVSMKSRIADCYDTSAVGAQRGGMQTYVGRDTVVPEHDGVWLPPSADLAVDAAVDVVVEEV